ncbi:MAG: hypothetical protein IJV71_08760 [Lachnospiraceae bacterium]|nr:hypothetical protein [Lachnospiraceae bacterium]
MEGITLETLQVIIDAQTKPIRDELSKVQSEIKKTTSTTEKHTNKISSFFKKIGKTVAVALSIGAIISFSKSCIQLGSDLQEVQNVVDVTFGSMNEDINEFAKSAIGQFGLSELSAKQYTSTIGAMLKSMGIASDEMLVMSKNLTGLAGDMASFYNLTGEDAFAKIRAGISGETEPLKQLGINMSVANLEAYALSQGITKAYSEMEQAEQVMLRYNYLMQTTADAQGDFTRTSDSWANQTKVLAESFNSVKASIGQGLINVFTPVVRLLNEIIPKLQIVADLFKDFTAAVFGDAGGSETLDAAASSAGVLSSNMESVADAANRAKKALSGIDKLNNISSNSGTDSTSDMSLSGIGSGAGVASGMSDAVSGEVSKIKGYLNQLSNWIKSNFSGSLSSAFKVLSAAGSDIFSDIQKTAKHTWQTISNLKSPIQKWFNEDVTKYLQTYIDVSASTLADMSILFTTIFTDIWDKVALPVFENFIIVGLPMLTQFATEATTTFGVLAEQILTIVTTLWNEGIAPLLDQLTVIWTDVMTIMGEIWNEHGATIFENIRAALQSTGDFFIKVWNELIKPFWDGFMEVMDGLWKEHLAPVVGKLGDFVAEFANAAAAIYNNFILPVVSFLVDVLGPIFTTVFGVIFDVVGPILGNIVDAVGGIIDALTGVCEFIGGVFTGDWSKAWKGIQDIFGGIWNALVSIIKVPINLIIGIVNILIGAVEGIINLVIDGLNLLSFDVPDWVPGLGGKKFGFDLDHVNWGRISYLAKGGIVNSATPAIIGEAGKEAVLPLENNTGWMDILVRRIGEYNNNGRLYDAICYLADKIGDGNIYVKVDMDGDVVYEKIEARRQQLNKMKAGYA